MVRSSLSIATTHTGSLPRPERLLSLPSDGPGYEALLKTAVQEAVENQVAAGIDVVSDGEMSKPGFVRYVRSRLNGFEETQNGSRFILEDEFPDYIQWLTSKGFRSPRSATQQAVCVGPLSWKDRDALR